MKDPHAYQDPIAKGLADRGLVIEAGWVAMLAALQPLDPDKARAMEFAYWGGAQHLWAMVMRMLDPGEEPTNADMARMDGIAKELEEREGFLRAWLEGKGGKA